MEKFESLLLTVLKNVQRYKKNFEQIPKVHAFLTGTLFNCYSRISSFLGEKFAPGPIVNKMAAWGGDKELKKS